MTPHIWLLSGACLLLVGEASICRQSVGRCTKGVPLEVLAEPLAL